MNSRIRNKSVEIFFFCQCPDAWGTDNILFRGWLDYQGVNEFDYEYTKVHELGHGAYRLRHIFSEENRYREEQGKTSNLMDYVPAARAREAEELKKYQWDYIHDPEVILFARMEEEEEGEIKKLKGTYTIWVGDSVVKDKKVLIYTKKENKIYIKYDPTVKDTNKYIHAKIYYRQKGKKEEKCSPVPINNWWNIKTGVRTMIKFDSLPEGNYRICIREDMDKNSKIDTVNFYLKDEICETYGVKGITWISQISTEIKDRKGRNCHWCSTFGISCCNGGTPCDTCSKDKKTRCCYVACQDSTLKNKCDSCNNKKICKTSECKTNNCCYETSLAMIEKCGVTTSRSLAIDVAKLANEDSWAKQIDLIADMQKFDEGVEY